MPLSASLTLTETSPSSLPVRVPLVSGHSVSRASSATGRSTATQEATIRALHVVNGEHFSGAERVQSHLGRCLPDFGVTADFVSVKPGLFTQTLKQQNGRWGRSFEIPMAHRVDWRAFSKLVSIIKDESYQLIHAHTPRTAMLAAIASMRTAVPWIYHVHSPAARDSARGCFNRINAWIEARSLTNCQGIITVSETLRADCLSAGHDPAKISVVHNGVPHICPPRKKTPQVGGPWVFGMVALMRPRKGLELALQSLARLKSVGHDVRLRCIGCYETEKYRQSIDRLIESLDLQGVVVQEGFVEDVPELLAELDALILPSLYGEGLPMVILEAMAAAVPVVATRVEGTPEAITHGVEGLLAEPGNAESLADQLASLISGVHDWSAMAAAAKNRHCQAFSDTAMAKGTSEVYRRVLTAG